MTRELFAAICLLPSVLCAAFDGRHVTMEFAADGCLASLREKATGRELVARRTPFVAVRKTDGTMVWPKALSVDGNRLTFAFASGEAVLKLTPFDGGWTVETVAMSVPDAEVFAFGRVACACAEQRGGLSNAVVDGQSGVVMRGYTPEIELGDLATWSGDLYDNKFDATVTGVFVERRFGFVGKRAGLAAGPYGELREMLKAMAAAGGVPLNDCGGPWSRGAEANRASYLFVTRPDSASFGDWLRLAAKTGARTLHLFRWWKTIGHYEPNPECFPGGWDELGEFVRKSRAAGYHVGTHTLSAMAEFGDPFVSPEWFDDFETDADYTLAKEFRRGDTELWINEKPIAKHAKVLTGSTNGNILRLGDDLLQYAGFTTEPPYRFTGITMARAPYGEEEVYDDTQAGGYAGKVDVGGVKSGKDRVLSRESYPAGTSVGYLHHRYKEFTPKMGSRLAEATSQKLADVFNRLELDEIYFDGAEACASRAAVDDLRARTFAKLDRRAGGTVNGTSSREPFAWWFRSLIGTWDHAKFAPKRFMDRHIAAFGRTAKADLLANDFGWFKPCFADATARGYFEDEAQYFGCKCAANDAMVSIQGIDPTDGPIPFASDVQATICGWWDRARFARTLRPDLLKRMIEPGREFRLRQSESGTWCVTPFETARHRVGSDVETAWRAKFPQDAKAEVRVEALYVPDGSKSARRLFDASMLAAAQTAAAEGVRLEATKGTDAARGETIRLTAENAAAPVDASWCRLERTIPEAEDLRMGDVTTVWVKGDGSGAVLNVQVQARRAFGHCYSENFVTLDFTGWRKIDLLMRERDTDIAVRYRWPYDDPTSLRTPFQLFRSPAAGKPIDKLSFYLNGIPQGGRTTVEVGAWETRPLTRGGLAKGSAVRLNGRELVLPFDLPSGDSAELADGFWTRYAESGVPVARAAAADDVTVRSGTNEIAFAGRGQNAFPRAEVTVFAVGESEPAFVALDAEKRTALDCEFELPFAYDPAQGLTGDFPVRVRPGERAALGFEIVGPAKNPTVAGRRMAVTLRDAQDHLVCEDGTTWRAERIVPGESNEVTENRVKRAVRTPLAEGRFDRPLEDLEGGTTRIGYSSDVPGSRVTLWKRYRRGRVALAADGKALASIVVSASAGKVERFAAEELKTHLDAITGADFPIVTDDTPVRSPEIRVGASERTEGRFADFQRQEYAVSVTAEAVDLLGLDRKYPGKGMPGLYDLQGTLYAVYDFLERDCGVRWLNPTDHGTWMPKEPSLSVPVGARRQKPAFKMRGGAGIDVRKPLLWKTKSEGERIYNEFAFASVGADPAKMNVRQRLFLLRHRAGGELVFANHSLYGWYERFWEKVNDHFEGHHPEYFAKDQPGIPGQLCYSDPRTVAQAIKDARDYFDNGGYKYVSRGTRKGFYWGENNFALEPMDGGGFCRCPDCAKDYEPARKDEHSQDSTYWFRFVNTVARALKESHPGKTVSTLAYSTHEGMPTGIRMEDNVVVHFCVYANREPASPVLKQQLGRMKAWRDAYPDMKIGMWLYNCFPKMVADQGNFRAFPGFTAHAAGEQFRFFSEIGATTSVFYDGFNGDVDSYVHLALLQDPLRSVDGILDEFFAPLGACGRHLRNFYEIIEKRYCDPRYWPKTYRHERIDIAWGWLGTDDVMQALEAELKAAEAAATTDFERNNARLVRLGVWNYMTEGAEAFRKRSASPMPTWTARRVPSAGGEPDKVDWSGVEEMPVTYYACGTDKAQPYGCTMRLGHDGAYLYLELMERIAPSRLENAGRISPCDTWEFLFATERAQPYRYYITAPDGRILALSFGEINWRQRVAAAESGDETFKAKAKNDTTSFADRWVARFSFPLDWAASSPVRPGDTLYLNVARVMNGKLCDVPTYAVFTLTPYTTVHTADRTAAVKLEAEDVRPAAIGPATLICHRGERSGGARDNSLAAFEAAVSCGMGFECDIDLDESGRAVCRHGKKPGDPEPPAFAEALKCARDGRWIVVDVKCPTEKREALAAAVKADLAAQKLAHPGNLFFICDKLEKLATFRKALPEYKSMWLTGCAMRGDFPEEAMTADEIVAHLKETGGSGVTLSDREEIFTKEFLGRIRAAGYEVHMCTRGERALAEDAFRRGALTVTPIIRAREILEEEKGLRK